MRCHRCGFEIEPGQTFCSMCGTEQSKAIREPKKKIKSILGIVKVASDNHLKMYINLGLMILAFIFISIKCKGSDILVTLYCLGTLLAGYIFIECMIPYKNPNASKSKKYKLGVRISFILIILLVVLAFVGDISLTGIVRDIF